MSNVREFFGGAITAELPQEFVDISTIRDVPNNQEVFSDQDTDSSLVIEILEYESDQSDDKAGIFFYEDLAEANQSLETKIEVSEVNIEPEAMPCVGKIENSKANVVIGTQKITKFKESAANVVRVFLCNLRLPKYGTDLLISLNSPIKIDPNSSSALAVDANISLEDENTQLAELKMFKTFLKSFRIVNPGLFGS